MKSILLIGLGRFGRHVAEKLYELDHQVMAVDKQEDRVEAVMSYVTNAQIGDSTNMEFLETLGVSNFDVCIVAIASDFQSSLETTAYLKDLGAKMVVSRASRDVHARFLLRNGVEGHTAKTFSVHAPVPGCGMVQMRSSTQKSRWQTGQLSATAQSIYLTMCSSVTLTLFLRLKCLRTGWERPSDR